MDDNIKSDITRENETSEKVLEGNMSQADEALNGAFADTYNDDVTDKDLRKHTENDSGDRNSSEDKINDRSKAEKTDDKETKSSKKPLNKKILIIAGVIAAVLLAFGIRYLINRNDTKVILGQYKGLEYSYVEVTVTDAEVEEKIKSIVDAKTTYKKLEDRNGTKTKNGDIVNCTYKANYEGRLVEEGTGNFSIGTGEFVEFENAITDKIIGETITVVAVIPKDYKGIKNLENIAGREINFEVKLNYVSEKNVPEVNDEFVKNVTDGKCTEAAAFEDYIRQELLDTKNEAKEAQIIKDLTTQIIRNSTFKNIDKMVDEYYDTMYQTYESGAKHFELSMEDYVQQFYSLNVDEFKKKLRETMVELVKEQLVLKEIVKVEKLEISPEKYDEYMAKYLQEYDYDDKEAFIEYYGRDSVEESMLYDYAIEFVIKNAKGNAR